MAKVSVSPPHRFIQLFDVLIARVPSDFLEQRLGRQKEGQGVMLNPTLTKLPSTLSRALSYGVENLGACLGLQPQRVCDAISAAGGDEERQICYLLLAWVELHEENATVKALLRRLYNAGETRAVQEVAANPDFRSAIPASKRLSSLASTDSTSGSLAVQFVQRQPQKLGGGGRRMEWMQSEIDDLQQFMRRMKVRMEELSLKHDTEIVALEAKLGELEKENHTLKTNFTDLEKKIKEVNNKLLQEVADSNVGSGRQLRSTHGADSGNLTCNKSLGTEEYGEGCQQIAPDTSTDSSSSSNQSSIASPSPPPDTLVPSGADMTDTCTHPTQSTHISDVYWERQFEYTGKKDHLLWDKYGIELHLPSTFPEVHIKGTVSVLSTDHDNYIFPEGSELVSAVYNISANKPFPESVMVKVQHCVPIYSANEASAMSFVIANTAQGPPYKFQPLSGGNFRHGSSYAEIQLAHFSILAIVIKWVNWMWSLPIPCSASIYYFQNRMASFVVTKNLEAHISAVKYSNKSALHSSEFSMIIDKYSSGIRLKLPQDSVWKVIPHVRPAKINMAVVLDYQPGRTIPQIKMDIRCEGEGQPLDNFVTVELRGVREPSSFRLMCTQNATTAVMPSKSVPLPEPSTQTVPLLSTQASLIPPHHSVTEPTVSQLYRLQGRSGRTVKVIPTAASSWRKLAFLLGLSGATVDNIEMNYRFQIQTACEKALCQWMTTATREPVLWQTLIQALREADLNTLATDLELVLREETED